MLDIAQRRRLLNDNRARFGIAVIVVMALAAIAAPWIASDPLKIDLTSYLQKPSGEHWLGTDVQGRDIWSRLVYGARVSLTVGLIAQGIALLLGVSLGLAGG